MVALPGIPVYTETPTSGKVEIFNATDLARIRFRILFNQESRPEDFLGLFANNTASYTLEVTQTEGFYDCAVNASSDTFTKGRFDLDWEFGPYGGGTSSYPGEPVEAMDLFGNPVDFEIITGADWAFMDFNVVFLAGTIYYSDGITPFPGAVADMVLLGGRRYPEALSDHFECGPNYSIGGSIFVPQYEQPSIKMLVRACAPGECGPCTDLVELDYYPALVYPTIHNFILPVDPPSPTATPTPTVTFTATPTATPSATGTPTYATDINRDSKVDVEDLLILMKDWRKVSGP